MNNKTFQWAVVGAGPAGIAAVGKLLDNHIAAEDILWLDPHFSVGDLGMYWRNVSSNTKVKYFKDFLYAANSFTYQEAPIDFALNHLPEHETCTLTEIVAPLQWVSDRLTQQVHAQKATIHRLNLTERVWYLYADSCHYCSKNVILATGALPSSLPYAGTNVIPFDTAIDKEKLAASINRDQTFAVFGSSHSAIIILRYLVELGVKRVINFYRSPCRYAVDMDGWILFDNTGLKGQTALWAREYIDGTVPHNLERYYVNEANIARYLTECDQVIYAVGFEARNNLLIDDYEQIKHNPHTGIIGPGLFGFGIAYPELKTDPVGNTESQVGLWKFMVYLNKIIPIWLKYPT